VKRGMHQLIAIASAAAAVFSGMQVHAAVKSERALLISIDGAHSIDMTLYVEANPSSALAELSKRGVTYPNARTPLLGDSSPGLLSLVTGGSPAVTGIIYSPTYDRKLSPPDSKDCSKVGTVVYIDEKAVKDYNREDSGGGIDPAKLPRDPAKGCSPVYPRALVRVNNVFDVVKRAGGRTAWLDQHDMYNELLKGPEGTFLDDSRALERKGTPMTLEGVTAQDARRVDLLLNQIRGFDNTGKHKVGAPKVFGLGFIAVGVVQKARGGGYVDAKATPSGDVQAAFEATDRQLARIIAELKAQKLFDSTLIIVSSKHGQSPIDLTRRRVIDRNVVRNAVNGVQDGLLAHASLDAIGLIWLNDSTKTETVAKALRAKQQEAGIQKIYWGAASRALVNAPHEDSRAPDIVIQPELGAFYADNVESEATRALIAEHGGMQDEDTNVPLLVSYAGARGTVNKATVHTTQVAPTILAALGLDHMQLRAVQLEGTPPLPGLP
jgi:hypothetical protein